MKTLSPMVVAIILIASVAQAQVPKYQINTGALNGDGSSNLPSSMAPAWINAQNPDGSFAPVQVDSSHRLLIAGSFSAGSNAATPTPSNGTTSATVSTFMQALAANGSRKDCQITNRGTGTQYVYEGAPGGATAAAALGPLAASQTYRCLAAGVVYQGVVSISSTVASDPYSVSDYQ